MAIAENLVGQVFGRLKVIERVANKGKHTAWRCACECGNVIETLSQRLKNGESRSCGCWMRDNVAQLSTTHGKHATREYNTWIAMKQRCLNPKSTRYEDYGGRGISVCDRWVDSFQNFYDDLGPKPAPDYSLDRIYVNGNYEPTNCKWSSPLEQASNKRSSKYVVWEGEVYTYTNLSRKLGKRPTYVNYLAAYYSLLPDQIESFVKERNK